MDDDNKENSNNNNNNNADVDLGSDNEGDECPPYSVSHPDDEEEANLERQLALKRERESEPPQLQIQLKLHNAGAIDTQMNTILEYATASLNLTHLMDPIFKTNGKTKNSLALATAVQANTIDLVSTRAQMRRCLQLTYEVLKYKPADTSQCDAVWKNIISSAQNIISATIDISAKGAQFYGFLIRIFGSLQYFHTSQFNAAELGREMSMEVSLRHLHADMADFSQFADVFSQMINKFKNTSLDALEATMNAQPGANVGPQFKALRDAEEAVKRCAKNVAETEHGLKEDMQNVLQDRMKLATEEGALEELRLQVAHLNGTLSDYEGAMQRAQAKREEFLDRASRASNTRKELWTRTKTILGIVISEKDYYRDIETGEKDQLSSSARHWEEIKRAKESGRDEKQRLVAEKEGELKTLTKRMTLLRNSIKETETKISEQLKGPRDELARAHRSCEKALANIQKLEIDTGIQDPKSMQNFLTLSLSMNDAMNAAVTSTSTLKANLKLFHTELQKKCSCAYTIKDYFRANELDTRFVQAFADKNLVIVEDLECDSLEDYKENFLPIIEALDAKFNEKRKLQRICWTNKQKWKTAAGSVKVDTRLSLLAETPVLATFFEQCGRRLDRACKALQFTGFETAERSPLYLEIKAHKQQALKFQQIQLSKEGRLAIEASTANATKLVKEQTERRRQLAIEFERTNQMKEIRLQQQQAQAQIENADSKDDTEEETDIDSDSDRSGSAESPDYKQLLTDWQLEQYIRSFKKGHFTNVSEWNQLEREDLDDLFNKDRHRERFTRKLKQFRKQKRKRKQERERERERARKRREQRARKRKERKRRKQRRRRKPSTDESSSASSDSPSVSKESSNSSVDNARSHKKGKTPKRSKKNKRNRSSKSSKSGKIKKNKRSDSESGGSSSDDSTPKQKPKNPSKKRKTPKHAPVSDSDGDGSQSQSESESQGHKKGKKSKTSKNNKRNRSSKSSKSSKIRKNKRSDSESGGSSSDDSTPKQNPKKHSKKRKKPKHTPVSDSDSDDSQSQPESGSGSESEGNVSSKKSKNSGKKETKKTSTKKPRSEPEDSSSATENAKPRNKRGKKKKTSELSQSVSDDGDGDDSDGNNNRSKSKTKGKKKKKRKKMRDIVVAKRLFKSIDDNDFMKCYLPDLKTKIKIQLIGDRTMVKSVKKVIGKGERKKRDVYICVKETHRKDESGDESEIEYVVTGAELGPRPSDSDSD